MARRVYDARRLAREAAPVVEPIAAYPRTRPARAVGDEVLDFGRHAGRTLSQLAREDPDYLRWLARTPIGRRYQATIEHLLSPSSAETSTVRVPPRDHRGLFRRMTGARAGTIG